MPQNIDDVGDDPNLEQFLGKRATEQDPAISGQFARLKSEAINEINDNLKKFALRIAGASDTFQIKGDYEKYVKQVEENVRERAKTGLDMRALENDAVSKLQIQLKSLDEVSKKGLLTARKRIAAEDQLIIAADDALKFEKLKLDNLKLNEAKQQQMEKMKIAGGERYDKAVSKVSSWIEKIPGMGGTLSKSFQTYANDPERKERGSLKIGESIESGGTFAKLESSMSKMAPIIILLGGAIAWLVNRIIALIVKDLEISKDMVIASGMVKDSAKYFEPGVKATTDMLKNFNNGIAETRKNAIEAFAGIVKAFGTGTQATTSNIKLVAAMSSRLGVGGAEAGGMVQNLQRPGGLSELETLKLMTELRVGALTNAVAFNQVLMDTAKNASVLRSYTDGTAKGFADATINAKKLGTTIESQVDTAKQFSTFEGAATNAMKLQFLTGQKFNALQMYTQANYGDGLSMQEQMLDKIRGSFEGQKNRGIKGMMAEALGMTGEQVKTYYAAKDEEKKLSSLLTPEQRASKNSKYYMAAARYGKDDIGTRGMQIKKDEEKFRKESNDLAAVMGLKELNGPMEEILARIYKKIDGVLIWLTDSLTPMIIDVYGAIIDMADWFSESSLFGDGGKAKEARREKKEQEDRKKKFDEEEKIWKLKNPGKTFGPSQATQVLKLGEKIENQLTTAPKTTSTLDSFANGPSGFLAPMKKATGTGPEGFLVPSGFENDSYPLRVSSGERVQVDTPAQQKERGRSNNSQNITITIPVYLDSRQIAKEIVHRSLVTL